MPTAHDSFSQRFFVQLGYWSKHCCLNALPSFLIALLYLRMFESPVAIVAMLLAIVCFIFTYAVLTSLPGPHHQTEHPISRALKLATKIRAWISGISLIGLVPPLFMAMPDFWCGMMASGIVNKLGNMLGFQPGSFSVADQKDFITVFATTLVEGVILSFILLLFAFFSLLFIQRRAARSAFLPRSEPS